MPIRFPSKSRTAVEALPSRTAWRPTPATLLTLLALVTLSIAACGPSGDGGGGGAPASNAVLLPVPSDPTVTFMVWLDVGSSDDPAGKEGLAALTGALIAGGATENRSYEQILEQLYPIASSYNVRVDKEMTTLSGRTHRDNLELFYELFSDAYLRPASDASDFERLKSDQKNAIETGLRYADDEELGKAALQHFVFEGTPYAHPVQGTVKGLDSITLDEVKAFYQQYYTAANARVALGGGFDDALLQRFEASLESLPAGGDPPPPSIEAQPIEGRSALLVAKPGADASISFGFPVGVSRGEDDFYALWVANSWLGEHRNSSSHLYQVIRETRGMNYGDYSYIEAFPEGGRRQMPPTNVGRSHQLFEIWIRTLPNEQAIFALRAALRELESLISGGLDEEEFQLTRSFLEKYHLHFADTTSSRLGYRVDDAFYQIGGDGHLARFGAKMRQLTREQVNAAVTKHLQSENMKIAIVTGAAEELAKGLASGEPTPITYANPKSAEVLAEDEEIASYPLGLAADAVSTVKVEEIFEQ
ncbi:MAG: insulinase family protein [Holophagales bacterium]|nr:insulinase family protein [Holophagales bacterium]